MADADLFPNVGDFVVYVSDGNGGESVGRKPDGDHDQYDDWMGGLGEGSDSPRAGVVDGCAISSVSYLSAHGED